MASKRRKAANRKPTRKLSRPRLDPPANENARKTAPLDLRPSARVIDAADECRRLAAVALVDEAVGKPWGL